MSGHNVLQEMAVGAQFEMVDPGASGTLRVDRDRALFSIVTATAEARTLAQPVKAGWQCAVVLDTDGGDLTLTVTGGWNQAGDTTMTLPDAGSRVVFHSIDIGGSYYWRVLRAEAVTEVYAEAMDVHALTALGAVPDIADLVAVSDESGTSDPTRSVTVLQLLSAAGDATDLGAVPAVDDRIVLTDESTAGDPARSTTVENLFSALGDVTALGAAPATDDLMVCTDESASGDPIKAITVAQLFQTYFNDMTPGTGISSGTGTTCEHSVQKVGGLIKTTILVDLTGLSSSAAADVIGKEATANCHIGQITAAVNGTIFAGSMTCLETPAGGEPDIDIYSSDVATGTEDVAITHADLGTETLLLDCNGDLTAGTVKAMASAYPAANTYLYLVGSGGGTDNPYTAGILLIELWGK